jgi:hypothetical protein
MANLESLIQGAVLTATTATVVVVIVRAFLAERRERDTDKPEGAGDEICPHCGQSIPVDGTAPAASPKDNAALRLENVIRPSAWSRGSGKKGFSVSRWLSDLSAFTRAVVSSRDKSE